MDRSTLAARIQEILNGGPKPQRTESVRQDRAVDEEAAFAERCAADEVSSSVADVLGGRVIEGTGGRCLVIERHYPATFVHGRAPVERYSNAARASLHALPRFVGSGVGSGAGVRAGQAGGDGVGRANSGSGGQVGALGAGAFLRGGQADLFQPALPRLLFFDLETTGLSGGAGTYAFLVGCGEFDGCDFFTRQFFLRGYGEERALLDAVRDSIEGDGVRSSSSAPAAACEPSASRPEPPPASYEPRLTPPCLVSYNGKAFDLPLIETRYLFHRRTSPFASLPHVDMLFPARRLWRRRPSQDLAVPDVLERSTLAPPGDLRASCALGALEQDILGLQRHDDVPGWEIPARYFTYTRTGDARCLSAVLEHNRLDLLSLASLTGLILEMVVEQERVVRDRHDCLALARLLEYLGVVADAERCYERAALADGSIEGVLDRVARAEALHWLAIHRRRARRFAEAADAWRGLLEIPGLDAGLRREACEALAIHHEHRAKDLESARSFALRALDVARGGRFAPDVEHRLDRLSRKLGSRRPGDDVPRQAVFPVEE